MFKLILSLIALIISSPSSFAADWCNNANMKGAWKLEETSGTFADCTTNANNGTLSGTINRGVTGKYNLGVEFTQSNNAVIDVGSGATLLNVRPISTGGWIAPDDAGDTSSGFCGSAGAGIIAKTSGSDGWALCLSAGGANIVFSKDWSGGSVLWFTNSAPIGFTGTFQHVVAVYNASSTSDDALLYYNGVSQSVNNPTPSGSLVTDASITAKIGITTSINEFDGDMDEMFIYNGNLTATDINDIMTGGLDGTQSQKFFNIQGQMTINGALYVK